MHTATMDRNNTHTVRPTSKATAPPARSAVVIGRPSEVRYAVERELTRNDASVTVLAPEPQTSTAVTDGIRGSPTTPATTDPAPLSMIIVTAHPQLPRTRRGLWQWRARAAERTEQQHLTDLAVSAASTPSACRVLVVCDIQQTPAPTDAVRWAKQLAVDIGYQAQINGTTVQSTSYLVAGNALSVNRAAQLAEQWHRRPERNKASNRPRTAPKSPTRNT